LSFSGSLFTVLLQSFFLVEGELPLCPARLLIREYLVDAPEERAKRCSVHKFEYCELWWSEGNRARLTFYKPLGTQTVTVEPPAGDADSWEALEGAIAELGRSGWELASAPIHSGGLFFQRHLN
jgi:hypothetical protein